MHYGRKAYGAQRKVSHAKTVQYIVESIRAKQTVGRPWFIKEYTHNPETIVAVDMALKK